MSSLCLSLSLISLIATSHHTPLCLQSASATAMLIAVTSPSGHGSPPVAPVGAFVMSADTTLSGAGASAVATAIAATHPCPSTPPTHAHVRDTEQWRAVGLDNVFSAGQKSKKLELS